MDYMGNDETILIIDDMENQREILNYRLSLFYRSFLALIVSNILICNLFVVNNFFLAFDLTFIHPFCSAFSLIHFTLFSSIFFHYFWFCELSNTYTLSSFAIQGGITKLPLNPEFKVMGIKLDCSQVFFCMAKSMILGLEGNIR